MESGFWIPGVIVTVATGLLAEHLVGHNDAAHAIMETHKTFGLMILHMEKMQEE